MPLRQSRLNFGSRAFAPIPLVQTTSSNIPAGTYQLIEHSPDSDVDSDTIVVDVSDPTPQLPTPSESVTELSSQGSASEKMLTAASKKSQRVDKVRKSRFREEAVDDVTPTDETNKQHSNISGETLASSMNISAKEEGLVLDSQSAQQQLNVESQDDQGVSAEMESITVQPAVVDPADYPYDDDPVGDALALEAEQERAERMAAKLARMAENDMKWRRRREEAEKGAVRRSKRAYHMFPDPGQFLLDVVEAFKSSGSAAQPKHSSSDERPAKRQRVSQVTDKEPPAKTVGSRNTKEVVPSAASQGSTRRDKKWLVSGLYAGQARTFDARLNETSNKKKTVKSTDPETQSTKERAILPLPMFAGDRLLQQGRDFKLPFDIFSPAPPGQAKPQGWKKQNRNYLVGDACEYWRKPLLEESSTCICQPTKGCDADCLNRTMYYECDENNCNLSEYHCTNRQWSDLARRNKINMAFTIGVDVVKTSDRGHGVRANRCFSPGQIILEYTGEIITQEECEKRMRTTYKDNDCYYLMLFDQNMILDATVGSMARFVNHSCEPNCRMEKWTVQGHPRMALFAGDRGVTTGEELTYDYNFDPYSQKNVQKCLCGSKNCRGFLGPKPKDVKQKSPEEDEPRKASEGKLAGAKRKIAQALGESVSSPSKKKKKGGVLAPAKSGSKGKQSKTASPDKLIAVKKTTKRNVSMVKTTTKKLGKTKAIQKAISEVKKSASAKGKRVVGSKSIETALIKKGEGVKKSKAVSRSASLKEKATALKNNVVRSVKRREE